jgi:hypothetical protein
MPAKKKLNGDLLTAEEMQSPMGLGYVSAAERLGLIYLYELKVIAQLLVDYANDAYEFAQTAHAQIGPHTVDQFWATLDKKADKLVVILKGQNPAYMATSWFTDPNQMAASRSTMSKARWLRMRDGFPANPVKTRPNTNCPQDSASHRSCSILTAPPKNQPTSPSSSLKVSSIR